MGDDHNSGVGRARFFVGRVEHGGDGFSKKRVAFSLMEVFVDTLASVFKQSDERISGGFSVTFFLLVLHKLGMNQMQLVLVDMNVKDCISKQSK